MYIRNHSISWKVFADLEQQQLHKCVIIKSCVYSVVISGGNFNLVYYVFNQLFRLYNIWEKQKFNKIEMALTLLQQQFSKINMRVHNLHSLYIMLHVLVI